jgi:hypothetical protein
MYVYETRGFTLHYQVVGLKKPLYPIRDEKTLFCELVSTNHRRRFAVILENRFQFFLSKAVWGFLF